MDDSLTDVWAFPFHLSVQPKCPPINLHIFNLFLFRERVSLWVSCARGVLPSPLDSVGDFLPVQGDEPLTAAGVPPPGGLWRGSKAETQPTDAKGALRGCWRGEASLVNVQTRFLSFRNPKQTDFV